jgi:hypothetical protein
MSKTVGNSDSDLTSRLKAAWSNGSTLTPLSEHRKAIAKAVVGPAMNDRDNEGRSVKWWEELGEAATAYAQGSVQDVKDTASPTLMRAALRHVTLASSTSNIRRAKSRNRKRRAKSSNLRNCASGC